MNNWLERRITVRHAISLPIKVKKAGAHSACERQGITRDLSNRGVYFMTDADFFLPGNRIEVFLTLPKDVALASDVHIHCHGRVLRVDSSPNSYGIAAVIDQYEFMPV